MLFTTRYLNAALERLRAGGHEVREEDVARVSPFVRHHINMLGRHSFALPEMPGGLRPLRGRTAPEDEREAVRVAREAGARGRPTACPRTGRLSDRRKAL